MPSGKASDCSAGPAAAAVPPGGPAAVPIPVPQHPPRPPRVLDALYGAGSVYTVEKGLQAAADSAGCGAQLAAALR